MRLIASVLGSSPALLVVSAENWDVFRGWGRGSGGRGPTSIRIWETTRM